MVPQGTAGGSSPEENQALLDEMVGDRSLLLRRLSANIDYLCSRPEVDASRIAAIGFCFGGLCVLDIARGGLDVAGVVSFHGLLGSPGEGPQGSIAAKVLALHGWDDPLAPPDAVTAFAAEMSARDADWQLHAYGGTAHAFTNPAAQDPENGMQYQPVVTERAWTSMQNFLAELFSA